MFTIFISAAESERERILTHGLVELVVKDNVEFSVLNDMASFPSLLRERRSLDMLFKVYNF
jgi:hypothetical protein